MTALKAANLLALFEKWRKKPDDEEAKQAFTRAQKACDHKVNGQRLPFLETGRFSSFCLTCKEFYVTRE